MSGGGSRVSIPSSTWKTIQNIKEITANHSEEEIYAMLKECCMDPNETTQKLLLQGTIVFCFLLFLFSFVILGLIFDRGFDDLLLIHDLNLKFSALGIVIFVYFILGFF